MKPNFYRTWLALICLLPLTAPAEELYTGRTLVSSGVLDVTNDKISFHDVDASAGSRLKVISGALLRTAMGLDSWAGQTRGSLATESTVTSSLITDGTITNADIATGAAIALSKLATDPLARANHTGSQLLSTISDAGSLAALSAVASAQITDGTIVNADINASAAIALSKLATDPLARANHTGTQLLSTISDAGSLAALSAVGSSQITDGTIVNADISASAAIALTKLAQTSATAGPVIAWNGTNWAPAAAGGVDESADYTWTGTHTFGTFNATTLNATNFTLPNAAGSATLTSAKISLNTTDKLLGIHNGTKEVAIPLTYSKEFSFDPKAVCDGSVDRLFLFTVGSWAPKGITITRWRCSFEADPTTEVDLDLKRADAFIGVANAAVMDALDTTAGASTETTAGNINSGAVVAAGKVVYLEFGTAYSETTHQVIFEIEYEIEED